MRTMATRIVSAVRKLLHIDRVEAQQAELQRSFDEVRAAADRALARLDEISRSDDPLARFVHDAKSSTFRRQIKRETRH